MLRVLLLRQREVSADAGIAPRRLIAQRDEANETFAVAAIGGGEQGTFGYTPGGGGIRKRGGNYPCPLRHLVR
jgi:hypothetical protein